MAGRIKKLLDNELVGGSQNTEVYPVTSTVAVYDKNNKVLDDILKEKDNSINTIKAGLNYVVCSTGASTAAKTVTIANYGLAVNVRLVIKMTYANTASSPTLNVNNTGAKNLYYNGAAVNTDNTWEAGDILDIYYDGTNYQAYNFQSASAKKVKYDSSTSKLPAKNIQSAIDGLTANTNYLVCSTAAGTSAKVVNNPGFVLTSGCRLVIKMSNDNTAVSPTLNINNTGAKILYYNGEVVSSDNTWEAGETVDVYYDGTNFYASNVQGGSGSGGNMILEWNTDVVSTRKQVKANKRKAGMQISYLHPDNGWINEQYIGTSFTDSNWQNDSYWRRIADKSDIDNISEAHLESIRTIVNEIGEAKQETKNDISRLEESLSSELVELSSQYSELNDSKQDKIKAGENIHIDQETNTISADKVPVLSGRGDSETATMSQKSISEEIGLLDEKINSQKSEVDLAKESAIQAINNAKEESISDFSSQRVTPEMLSESTLQLINSSGGGIINNVADDEDLYSTGGETPVLKFKDREYNPSSFSGLAHKILRKNISGSRNVLTQDMVNDANTIYEVRYDYDLNGSTISFGENTVILFTGGSFSNGIIAGNKTSIIAPIYKIFGDNLEFSNDSNSFYTDYVYAEWWGAVGRFPKASDITATYPQDSPYSSESKELPDCSPYFNKAFIFAHRYSCSVKALGCTYAVRNTIKILENTTFITEENTVFCVYMKGNGKTVVTQSTETSKFSSEIVDEAPCYLKQNQYIDTSAMAVAFEVSSCRVKLLGRGTINTGYAQFCIGMLIKSRDYETLDMSYFLQIDLRFVGGIYGENAGDSKNMYGHGEPTDGSLNETGQSLYYIDLSSIDSNPDYIGLRLQGYEKKNGSNTWSKNIQFWRRLNTDLRFEMSEGGAGGRLIDPHIRIGCMFGFRGVEIITHDGGWFNISTWEGTISNKYGNYLSIFSDYDANSHNFSGLTMQWGYSNWETCVFYAIRTSGITIGASADLAYAKPKIEFGFYFGKYTSNCVQTWIDDVSYVVDLGKNNSVGYSILGENQTLAGTFWVNQWSKNIPSGKGFMKISSLPTLSDIEEVIDDVDNFTIEETYPYLFDDDNSTYELAIDTDNGLYGLFFLLGKNNEQQGLSENWSYLEIDYAISGDKLTSYEDGLFKVMLCGTGYNKGITNTHLVKEIRNERSPILANPLNYVHRMLIPLNRGNFAKGRLAFFTESLVEKVQLQIYGIKLWTTNFALAGRYTYNNLYPKNSYYQSEDGSFFINMGDAKNNAFLNIKDGSKMQNDIILTMCISSKGKSGDVRVQPYGTGKASYELIDKQGYISAKMNNNVEGNSGIFPGGYNTGYRNVSFITTNIPEDYQYPYYFKIKFSTIVGFSASGYYLTNLIDILQQGAKELTFTGGGPAEQGVLLLDNEDISRYVSDVRYLDINLSKDISSNGSHKALVSTGSFNAIEYLHFNNSIKLYGNLSMLPNTLYDLYITKGEDITYNTVPYGKIWSKNFSQLYINNASKMTSEMIDALLIDIADSVVEPTGITKQIKMIKAAGNRTIASDAAVAVLESLGFTISITT